jgi:hypothetical protein
VSPVKYELGFYIQEDILHSHSRKNLKSYVVMNTSAFGNITPRSSLKVSRRFGGTSRSS